MLTKRIDYVNHHQCCREKRVYYRYSITAKKRVTSKIVCQSVARNGPHVFSSLAFID